MDFSEITATMRQLWQQKRNIATLVFSDFSQNYLSSYLGFAWAIVGPLVTLLVLALVFQMGFRVPPINDSGVPFVAWLTCGMVPWFFFSDGLISCAGAISSYGFLVRKAMFRIAFLPAIRLTATGIIHLVMMFFLLCVLFYFQIKPTVHWLQWFYYCSLMYLFLLGVAWCSSSLSIFVPDVTSALGIATNLGFWATPIFWNSAMLPVKWHWIFTVNPAYYIVQGYRDTFIEHRWFWERPVAENAVFAVWLVLALFVGAFTFKKLRPHFADVI